MDTKIYYSKNISWQVVDDELYIFEEISGKLYLYTGIQKDFWLMISKENNLNKLINFIEEYYKINSNEKLKIEKLIRKLENENLIYRK